MVKKKKILSDKVYEQAIGFMRIIDGKNKLDTLKSNLVAQTDILKNVEEKVVVNKTKNRDIKVAKKILPLGFE